MAYVQKTKINDASVADFLDKIEDPAKKADCLSILDIFTESTGYEPKMWGTSIIGFGSYHYKYPSGHEGDNCLVGYSPRKSNITLYLHAYFVQQESVLKDLGKCKTGKGCLYINKMEDINTDVLKTIIAKSVELTRKAYQ